MNRKSAVIILIIIILYPLMFIRQGLDFTDTGFMLTNYSQIFNDPASVESSFRLWLTNILGGIWIYVFGDSLGVIGYRIAGVLLVYAAVSLAYLTLKPSVDRNYLLPGLLLAVVFINRSGYTFNYNSLTAFFYVLAAFLLIKGLQGGRGCSIFLAAFILGMNVFVRLPNIVGFLLITGVFFAGYIKKISFREQLGQAVIFAAGFLSAAGTAMTAMYLMGHLDAYINAVRGTFLMLNDPAGHHHGLRLAGVITDIWKMTFLKTGAVIIWLAGLMSILTISSRLGSRMIQYAVVLVAAAGTLNYIADFYQNWYGMITVMLGAGTMILIWYMFRPGAERDRLRITSFISLAVALIVPVGSNDGFTNLVYGMYLMIPLVFAYIFGLEGVRTGISRLRLRLSGEELKLVRILGIAVFLAFTLKSAYHYTYRDSPHRPEMLYGVEHQKLRGILTTKDRALVVGDLLEAVPAYVSEGDYLLAYEQVSLVYFLTGTKPYLYSSWPMLYSPAAFRHYLDRALAERPGLPVIVRARGNTEEPTWPRTRGLRRDKYLSGARKIMNDFIKENNYKIVWENSFFEILQPPESGGRYECR
ncbi:MAG: hypothetical protein CVU89_12595 [Firmicutes bacterium HGW-Firmicutes-14]|nr:MAG: hypothetical protein CVU89_12595 [Firmicutes bacterium HGW-Firmicutes-14]